MICAAARGSTAGPPKRDRVRDRPIAAAGFRAEWPLSPPAVNPQLVPALLAPRRRPTRNTASSPYEGTAARSLFRTGTTVSGAGAISKSFTAARGFSFARRTADDACSRMVHRNSPHPGTLRRPGLEEPGEPCTGSIQASTTGRDLPCRCSPRQHLPRPVGRHRAALTRSRPLSANEGATTNRPRRTPCRGGIDRIRSAPSPIRRDAVRPDRCR